MSQLEPAWQVASADDRPPIPPSSYMMPISPVVQPPRRRQPAFFSFVGPEALAAPVHAVRATPTGADGKTDPGALIGADDSSSMTTTPNARKRNLSVDIPDETDAGTSSPSPMRKTPRTDPNKDVDVCRQKRWRPPPVDGHRL